MKTLKQNKIYNAPLEQVFKAIDDLGVTGPHMTQSSGMMMAINWNWNTWPNIIQGLAQNTDGQEKWWVCPCILPLKLPNGWKGKKKRGKRLARPNWLFTHGIECTFWSRHKATRQMPNYLLVMKNLLVFLIEYCVSFLPIGNVVGVWVKCWVMRVRLLKLKKTKDMKFIIDINLKLKWIFIKHL